MSRSAARLGALLLLTATGLAAAAAPASAARGDVTVMTRNLYLGADLIPLATQPDRAAFEQAAAQRFQTVLANDFSQRAEAIALEVKRYKPDVIGIQEAAVWKTSPDGVKDGPDTEASELVYDSLEELDEQLREHGQRYRVVAKRSWFDYEAPTALGHDVRLTQQDAILVRTSRDTKVRAGRSLRGGFASTFDVPTPVGLARQLRGYVGFDGKVKGGRKVRFVTTHLEAYSPEIAEQQMTQLLRGPLSSQRRRSVLMGDFNSDPRDAGTDDRGADRAPNAYATALDADFLNLLPRRETCCFAEDLRSTAEGLDSWIDHIVVRPRMRVRRSAIVGSRSRERVGGLWPSDHAGIVATLRTRR